MTRISHPPATDSSEPVYDLATRTEDACGQLARYGGVFNSDLADLLDCVAEINDDLHNDRARHLIEAQVKKAQTILGRIAKEST